MSNYQNCKLRIPPSPTGNLHLGTARTGLYNLLIAKRYGGSVVLRLEDTDKERSKSEYTTDIIEGLQWLGIGWDEGPLRQSEHAARHRMVLDELIESGRVYECYCTTEELDEMRASQRAAGKPEKYDNRHRNLTNEEKEKYKAQGRKPILRFRLDDNVDLRWNDLVRGEMTVNTDDLGGDMVVAKASGDVLYNFAVVVDDHDSGITHVVRGEDHLHNTAKQIALYKALGWDVPIFAHAPLIFTPDRQKLSKRKHGDIANVSMYREQGYLPEAINNYLIGMSWIFPVAEGAEPREIFTLEEAAEYFDLTDMSRSAAVYDLQKLEWISKEHFKQLSVDAVYEMSQSFWVKSGIDTSTYSESQIKEMISLIKDGLTKLSDIPEQLRFFFEDISVDNSVFDEFEHVDEILKAFVDEINAIDSLTPGSAKEVLNTISKKLDIKKGKKLFMPIRLSISGQKHGPDLVSVISILGQSTINQRVQKMT